jgi:hypothetical protein
MAYIDAEITKRLQGGAAPPKAENNPHEQAKASSSITAAERQPASLGKLQEIDLGPNSKLSNVQRTAAAHQQLEEGPGGTGLQNEKEGKPRRGQKRRTSEDIRRDKLVEEVLRESRRKCFNSVSNAVHGHLLT